MRRLLGLCLILGLSYSSWANAISESVNGTYHLGTPERGAKQVLLQYGNVNGKNVLAVAACKTCMPAVYSYLSEESQSIGTAVFYNTTGLYVIQYDEESFFIVQPDAVLGRGIWSKVGHANIYSKNPQKAKSLSRDEIVSFSLALSKKIMNQETGKMAHSAGTYHLAVPQEHQGRPQTTFELEFLTEGKKKILVKKCDSCSANEYELLPDESEIAGVDIYRHATSYYLFDLKDGVLISTFSNAGGLGKKLWGSHKYNVYSNNKAYIRQILASKEKQNIIDTFMEKYFRSVKDTFEHRAKLAAQKKVENQTLPKAGMSDSNFDKSLLSAAKRWANAWSWKEELQHAYSLSHDWTTLHNPLTGITVGRKISGIVTMKHPDGRCRFQYAGFRQDYDGSQYSNLHMTGVGPIYDITCDKLEG